MGGRRPIPYNDYCPSCSAMRTFTLLGFAGDGAEPRLGCCVCGWTAGEPSVTVHSLAGEMAELRDELHEVATKLERQQSKTLEAAVALAEPGRCARCLGTGRVSILAGTATARCSVCHGQGRI